MLKVATGHDCYHLRHLPANQLGGESSNYAAAHPCVQHPFLFEGSHDVRGTQTAKLRPLPSGGASVLLFKGRQLQSAFVQFIPHRSTTNRTQEICFFRKLTVSLKFHSFISLSCIFQGMSTMICFSLKTHALEVNRNVMYWNIDLLLKQCLCLEEIQ